MRTLFGFAILIALLFFPKAPARGQQPSLPSPDEILDNVLAREKEVRSRDLNKKYTYTQLTKIEKLQDDLAVKETEERTYRIIPLDGAAYNRLVTKNGKPLSQEDLRREQNREEKFRKAIAKKQKKADEEDILLNKELLSKYAFSVIGRETVNGRSAFVLTFKPRSPDLPVKKSVDRFLNKLMGTVWFDDQDYELAKIEAKITEPVKVGWGIIASLYKFDLTFEQVRLDDGVWLPGKLNMYINGTKLFSKMHQRQYVVYQDFKKAVDGEN